MSVKSIKSAKTTKTKRQNDSFCHAKSDIH